MTIGAQAAIDVRLAGHEVLHAASGIEECKKEGYNQQWVDGGTIKQQAGQSGDFGYNDVVVGDKHHKGKKGKDDVIRYHTSPVYSDALLQSTAEEKVRFPKNSNKKHTNDFTG